MRNQFISFVVVSFVVAACDGDNGAPGAPAAATVFSTEELGATDQCPAGGVTVAIGTDENANEKLDANEKAKSFVLCYGDDGQPGDSPLVITTKIQPGAECANGGRRVDVGFDNGADGEGTAGNGKLEAAEISDSSVICNGDAGAQGDTGAQGDPGTPGLASLTAVTAEAAGNNCAAGGQKLSIGVDTDNDGVLDAGEVNGVSFVCNGRDAKPVPVLVKLTTEAAGANCAHGGQRIDSGGDDGTTGGTAEDGVLDPLEIDSTAYVCNGADGAKGDQGDIGFVALVETTPEIAGQNCAAGGIKLTTGLDDGSNGGTARATFAQE